MKNILFDLDGTLTDPKVGITKSVQHALKAFQIKVEDPDTLCCYIGPPLNQSFMEYHKLTASQAQQAIVKYREYFADKGIFENEVYDGIEAMLTKLYKEGKRLFVATSKPEVFARRILEHFGLQGYFEDICGATLDLSRSTKDAVIRYALEKNEIWDLSDAVMVGDRRHDVEGAKAVGIKCIGVLYGYGTREELKKAGTDRIAQTVEELYDSIHEM